LQSQIRDGVVESGATIILMDAGMDTGDVVLQERSPIGERETYGELHDRFALLCARMLEQALEQARNAALRPVPQASMGSEESAAATLTKPILKSALRIEGLSSPTMRAIVDHVRSAAPEPGARLDTVRWGPIKVLEASPAPEGPPVDAAPGGVVMIEGAIFVRATDGWVLAETIVLPGKRAATREEIMRGYPFTSGPREEELRTWLHRRTDLPHREKTPV
jgi:methionyl-tRNA formyltransferase